MWKDCGACPVGRWFSASRRQSAITWTLGDMRWYCLAFDGHNKNAICLLFWRVTWMNTKSNADHCDTHGMCQKKPKHHGCAMVSSCQHGKQAWSWLSDIQPTKRHKTERRESETPLGIWHNEHISHGQDQYFTQFQLFAFDSDMHNSLRLRLCACPCS